MVFLFSPDISLFDLMPDFIGWFLIVLGLGRLADIEIRAEDAKHLAKRMILFSAVKAVLSLFSLRFSSADLLLAAFCYAIVEIITVIPFTANLFKALDYTSMRVSSPLDSDKLNTAKWYLLVFFAIKNAIAVLPATGSLFDSSMTGEYASDTWFVDFAAMLRMFILLGFVISAVTSVVMLVYFLPFWIRIVKNRDLNGKMLAHRKVSVLDVPACMVRKNTSFVLGFFTPALVFFFDFYLDGIDVLPTFAGFAVVLAGSVYAKKYMKQSCMPLICVSALGFVVSLTAFLYRFIPLAKNKFVIDYNFSAKPLTLPLALLTSLLVIVTVILTYRLAGRFNESFTKYKLEDSLVLYMLGGAVLGAFDFVLYSYPNMNTTFVFPSLIFGTAFSAMGAYYFVKLGRQIRHDNKN